MFPKGNRQTEKIQKESGDLGLLLLNICIGILHVPVSLYRFYANPFTNKLILKLHLNLFLLYFST